MSDYYEIEDVVDESDVPGWERREPKWNELVETVLQLEPGRTLKISFDDPAVAERARNAVRDTANLRAGGVVVRTRLVIVEGERPTVFLTRVNPASAYTSK